MSYQHQVPQQQTLRGFVPTYQVRSDYLPTQVHETNNAQTADWVHSF